MCGIIGYYGKKELIPLLTTCLEKLQYRGYDSSGICVIDKDKNFYIQKKKGKIEDLKKGINTTIDSNIGIAHTRWATHGEPSVLNAHPHLDCKNEIAIVHNGIIENYQTLKEVLIKEGHIIKSETDSEILAHLIEKFYEGNIEIAVIKALECVVGTYGIAVVHKNENKIIAAKKGSPLVLGIGKDEFFISSDITAILDHTKKVIYLNDNEILIISDNEYNVKNLNGEIQDKEVHEVKWSSVEIEKSGYKHFMLKEIFEQPMTIENVLRGRIRDKKIKLSINIKPETIKRIIILACGTSWHSALIGKYLIEKMNRIEVVVDYASEFRYKNPIIKKGDIVIAISQSGETADTLAALKEAKEKNSITMGIVNVVGSEIARTVDSGIYLHAGPEIGVASTKAFSSQIIALLLFSLYLRQESGYKIDESILEEFNNIPSKINQVLKYSEKIRKLAEEFKDSKNMLYLGRGINFPIALEGALKLKEISYIHAEGYPAAEMKHGPIALVDENMPVIFILNNNSVYEKILSNIQEIKARKGKVIIITDYIDEKIKQLSDNIIEVPKTKEEFAPIINIIPLQLLAYHIADLKGIDVDKPRNLAKSVTVE
jgi:glutamine---fructose-6-phosphate transaminase (isomerizing)